MTTPDADMAARYVAYQQESGICAQLKTDPPRWNKKEGRREERLTATLESDSDCVVFAGKVVMKGRNEIELWESEVPALLALQETFLLEPIKVVTRGCAPSRTFGESGVDGGEWTDTTDEIISEDERGLTGEARAAASAHNKREVERDYKRSVRDYAAAEKSGGNGPRRYTRQYMPSMAASFRQIFGRDQRPFSSVTIGAGEHVDAQPSTKARRSA